MLFRLMGRRLRTGLRLLARDRFGLEIARIPEKRADVWYYEMNENAARSDQRWLFWSGRR